ncbi:1-acyl-sn-glycerol-3-phosphate acyltransferase [Anabaena cylindrica FACHB-243]|uniref:Phospholipid/glycerol acyltransferase n=1 Tax=Anabaena cylindrica (strain ATCC 27899 / PCC 7122) TaxID=272123 RepID=K9ZDW4_ANACC|nr:MULTISPECIES: 1-acyl-sn-glycerol-3-phosphate acyltransferase [Anabaena]AFZ57403.1 phospholipid/glycerol acyltransferase [Anabaena cylindrica PCC 7122]MBD2421085.1 1-acyl-sn-glycerol-3-phosphate acyltransferase [Anabaena cylindrica FACHB-243]MBY5284941.1 1-acyl-sn-glycerol-3-phosphate acyltransferase [Anabaena sp. CCAP 1446/1C]MBY5306345.1 1-acyl-sn-glycerol-3-phosphate acyltransferase [Anabaena sp. CCAP 1446/1C]MCM2405838.1 1-acyl-sn-glycerol-3-phosphate acyltransferase [Anabaena sp. CCAP 1
MPKSIHSTQPPLKFISPRFNPLILKITSWVLPFILQVRTRPWLPAGIVKIEAKNAEVLAKLYQEFQAGKIRFIIAFRHPEVEDPLSMFYLLSRIVPKVGREKGISLQYPVHSHFMYERGMTLWAGKWLGWLFSGLGGVPVRRGRRVDRNSIQIARDLLANAKFPIAIAPEGGTNGHSSIVSPLEPGAAQLGFWCVEDLQKANREEKVFIIPIGIKYSYVNPPWQKIDWLLSKLEIDSGLPIPEINYTGNQLEELLYQRLCRLAAYLIAEMEEFYRRFYHRDLPEIIPEETATSNEILITRLHRLMDTALQITEQYFNVQAQGNFIDRCRRLEEAGWNYIYRDDIADIGSLPPLKRGLADWVAEEADLRMQHMRIAESFVAVTANYILEKPTAERFAETALLMFDMLSRIQESTLPGRPRLGLKQAMIIVGEPISISERWESCQGNKQALRTGVSDLTKDLQIELEELIKD